MTHQEIIDKILNYHPTLLHYNGCDGYKAGDGKDTCTGVAVALVPTADVIKRAANEGCNLLVVHEPIFYQSPDFAGWMGDFQNGVYEEKQRLLKETGMTVWRDHDHMHAHRPDAIFSGVIRELGWESYYQASPRQEDEFCYCFEMPKTPISEIAEHLKNTLHLNGLKYMGNLDDTVSKVALVGHLIPGFGPPEGIGEDGFYHDYAMEIMRKMEQSGVELIIPGEIIEWTVIAYIRDAIEMGRRMGCLNIGHYNLEELGMKDFADRIREQLGSDAPKVLYIPTQDGFSYL